MDVPITKVFGVSDPFFKKGLSLPGEGIVRALAASVPLPEGGKYSKALAQTEDLC